MKKHIPNFITSLNLFSGCIAIVMAFQGAFIWVVFWVILAAIFDFFDGMAARLLKAPSLIGKELDSLADVVSFGVAPAMIIFQFLRMSYAREEDGLNVSFLVLVPALIIAGAAAYRLGKFNIDSSQQYGFKGVPTPAVGLLIASFPLIYWNTANHDIALLLMNKWVLYSIIIILSWLMVSNIPLLALKFKDKTLKGNLPIIILVLITIISIPLFHWATAIIAFASYIILSLLFKPQR